MDISLDAPEPAHPGTLTPDVVRWLAPLAWRAGRIGLPSAWWEHVPFAHWLVSATAPDCLVELGTHAGVSYAAFCEAVTIAGTGTRCYAVDTWKGDSQAGEYGEEVFEELARFHDERYSGFSTMLRCTFDEALDKIPEGSVDILHIDGLHTYEAVRHDFESWKPKLSKRAVVLFHDINEYGGDFAVWRLWAELRAQHPSFEFLHGHGLGVLAVGEHAPAAVLALCAIEDRVALASVRGLFARLGERWWFETRERMVAAQLGRQEAVQAAQLDALRTEAAHHAADLQSLIGSAEQRLAVAEATAEQRVAVAEATTARVEAERQQLEQAVEALGAREAALLKEAQETRAAAVRMEAALLAEAQETRAAAVQMEASLRREAAESKASALALAEREQQRAAEVSALQAQAVALRQAAAETARRAAESERTTAGVLASLERARAENADLATTLHRIEAERVHATHERNVIVASTLWRAVSPLRTTGRYVPAGVRRALRGTAKLGWWTATLSLPQKLRERKHLLTQARTQEAARPDDQQAEASEAWTPAEDAAPVATARAPAPVSFGRSAVWISGEPDTPGHWYRVARPMAAAAALGVSTTWMRADEVPSRLHEIEAADTVFIWRAAWDENVALAISTARQNGVKVVFDVDDLMVDPELALLNIIDGIRSQDLTEDVVRSHYKRIRKTMSAADLCLATTEELAGHMRRAQMPTLVLPNGFDRGIWRLSRLAARCRAAQHGDGLVRLGYAGGSRTHQRDFALCADAVAEVLAARPECRLVLFRTQNGHHPCLDVAEFPALQGVEDRIEWRELVPLDRLPEELARLDVNLAPLEVGNPFCEAKSELKIFEAALVDVPTVASPTGPFSRALRHGVTGFLAGTPAEWRQALTRLVEDAGLRRSLGHAAGLDALWTFGPERRAHDVALMLDIAQGGPAAAVAFETYSVRRQRKQRSLPGVAAHEVLFATDNLAIADVTVVIPLYNYAGMVMEALESARLQTLERLDLVVVDDCSTDASLKAVLDWVGVYAGRFNRVIVARNKANQGLGVTRNTGLSLADSPWVMALDADNRLRPGCVRACLETAERTGAAFAYPVIQRFGDSTEQINCPEWDPTRLIGGNFIDAMALISRAAWAAAGGYDTVRTGWEDFDLWCCFAELGLRGEQVPGKPLADYRVHGSSMIQDAMRQRDKVRWMMGHLEQRHPWLHLISPIPEPVAVAALPPSTGGIAWTGRLDDLLTLLRCPVTSGELVLSPDKDALISADGTQCWPLIAGRPVFFRGLGEVRIVSEDHLSNRLPDSAAALIEQTRGKVLHLSAGGSAERYDHVIEAEAAIFRHTDIVADVHDLPFGDEMFEAVIALNAFEHYRDPRQAAREIMRVLKPGGRVLIRTAFLQPQHEAPWHFYNCTRHGLEAWFAEFETQTLWVSENFHAGHSLSWLASECEAAVRKYKSGADADLLLQAPMGRVVAFWRTPEAVRGAGDPLWQTLATLPQEAQEVVAAGFEYVGRKPDDLAA